MCVYCSKLFSKLSKHLLRRHSQETEVTRAFAFPKHSKERKEALRKLTHRGDFLHNSTVLRSGHGNLIAARRPSNVSPVEKFTTCEGCLGLFKKCDLWRHKRNCLLTRKGSRNHDPLLTEQLKSSSCSSSSLFRQEILDKLSPDLITFEVTNDPTIIQLGENLFKKSQKYPHQYQYVRQKMRELGRRVRS